MPGDRRVCKHCGVEKLSTIEFFPRQRKGGPLRFECRECFRRRHRRWVRSQPEGYITAKSRHDAEQRKANGRAIVYRAEDAKRRARRRAYYVLVQCGERPTKCGRCHRDCTPEAHHSDYTKPLDVEWLCSKCHGKEHRVHA